LFREPDALAVEREGHDVNYCCGVTRGQFSGCTYITAVDETASGLPFQRAGLYRRARRASMQTASTTGLQDRTTRISWTLPLVEITNSNIGADHGNRGSLRVRGFMAGSAKRMGSVAPVGRARYGDT
jgi:hypothetical protein